MSGTDRKESEVRRMMQVPAPVVPADLGARAAARGGRLLRRHRALRRACWGLLLAVLLALAVWALLTEPWPAPPAPTSPPVVGF
ncbi:hypothetical protein [Streptomyces genisteinicus]|uniref:Uncharacterized protein n=1 Tax=Streptomyces genisteinicus TaxID=2768068 RepID=A0A7H0HWQ2_9ACTN|nr:hypothetical protein [Streptomyces genisteinicus]QNP64968.1 hypothetical protein IAG43_20005 [Streptomyces genisteinicus]